MAKAAKKRKVPPRAPVTRKTSAKPPAKTRANSKARVKVSAQSHGKAKERPSHHPMMSTLLAEHRHMSTILKLLEKQLDLLEREESADTHIVYETMHYMAQYPDRFHHPREDVIFQRAAQVSSELADAVDTLQRDHDQMADRGKQTLLAIARWREGKTGSEPVVTASREYIKELFRHMEVEEELVFPMIEATLSADDWRELSLDDSLTPAADPIFGSRVDREFRNVARSARRAMRHGVEKFVVSEWVGFETLWESMEVLSMAADSVRISTKDHLYSTVDECREIVDTQGVFAPIKCTVHSLHMYGSWLREQLQISRDTLDDIGEVKKRVRADLKTLWSDR